MKYPNFREEKKLYKKGYKMVVGIDEAGRGPLAGPVVACAFIKVEDGPLPFVQDSKKLSAKKREKIYEILKKNPGVEWGIGRVSEKVIDKINILEATKLAMKRAVKNLERNLEKKLEKDKFSKVHDREFTMNNGFLIIDGNFGIDCLQGLKGLRCSYAQKSIIKGDQKVFSVAAASIVAKVYRDRMMLRYHKKYPEYRFDKHKGYGTELHRNLINKKGFCNIHRKSFHVKGA